MNSHLKSFIRFAAGAGAILGLNAAALTAREAKIQGFFSCTHSSHYAVQDGQVTGITVVVAGAGHVSHMEGPVVCLTEDENPLAGTATYTLRDITGDTLVLKLTMTASPPNADHALVFGGAYVIDGAKSTGRFAGAQGNGTWSGWADYDPPAPGFPPTSGQGHWEFAGTLGPSAQ